MDAIIVKVNLSYDSPVDAQQLQQLQDKFWNLIDAECNDGELSLDGPEVLDFEIEVERIDE
jgi:uncharacterized protein YggL (DUF469 family)